MLESTKEASRKPEAFQSLLKKYLSQPISRVLSWTVIHLGQASPLASSNLPVSNAGDASWKPIWSCSEWGLPCHCCYQQCGALLPHPFTLTCVRERIIGGLLSAALSVGLRPPGVTWHSTFWSPDFPLPRSHTHITERQRDQCSDCLVNSLISLTQIEKKISAQGDSLNSSWPITRAKTKFNAEENDPLAVAEISTMPIYVAYLDHLSDLLLEAE